MTGFIDVCLAQNKLKTYTRMFATKVWVKITRAAINISLLHQSARDIAKKKFPWVDLLIRFFPPSKIEETTKNAILGRF